MKNTEPLLTDCPSRSIKALLIDCDGVLYGTTEGSDKIIAAGVYKTLAQYGISQEEFVQMRADLKKIGIRGLFNTILELCNKYHISFEKFAEKTVNNTDYSQINPDPEMLALLKQVATVMPVYIVTNNTHPHLKKIFDCLRGKTSPIDFQEELGIHAITVENTLEYEPNLDHEIFFPKQMGNQFTRICERIHLSPACVGLIDDSEHIRVKAKDQGLVPILTNGPEETKQNLKTLYDQAIQEALYAKINTKSLPVR